MKRKRKRKDDTMKGENDLRRVEGAGAPDVPAPLYGVRIFDVLSRRIVAVKGQEDAAWEAWKACREDLAALHRYTRLVARRARLIQAAMMDLSERTSALLSEMEGRAA
jgi:hypothetical protein